MCLVFRRLSIPMISMRIQKEASIRQKNLPGRKFPHAWRQRKYFREISQNIRKMKSGKDCGKLIPILPDSVILQFQMQPGKTEPELRQLQKAQKQMQTVPPP